MFAYRQSTPGSAGPVNREIHPSLHSLQSASLMSPVQRARSSVSFPRPTKPPSKQLVGGPGLFHTMLQTTDEEIRFLLPTRTSRPQKKAGFNEWIMSQAWPS